MTHPSSPDISSANPGHSPSQLSLRPARWLSPTVKIPPDDTGYQRHLYSLQNIGPANARYLGTNQQSSDFDIGESQNWGWTIFQAQSEIFFLPENLLCFALVVTYSRPACNNLDISVVPSGVTL